MDIRADIRDFNKIYEDITDNSIKDAISQLITSLKNDVIVGEHVKYQLVPKYYIRRHGIQTPYRVSLPHRWRTVYSIQSFYEQEKTALLLELMDHKQHNHRFGYFKKKSS